MENKKIKGAKISEYNNIKFKSSLECSCYKKLELSSLEFSYESEKIVLWEGVKPQSVKIYSPKNNNSSLKESLNGLVIAPKLNIAMTTYYKETALEKMLINLDEYLDSADSSESDITYM